ncbi:MAG: DUF4446 family protein [Candidatus Pacebacteria bacterium]|nr:DUF4446 family protein [Candidatus Paceibacterota bacterium]
MNYYFYLVFGFLGFLLLINLFLFFYLFQLKKRIKIFFQSEGKNIEEVLTKQIKLTKKQTQDLKKIFQDLERLDKIAEKSFQKVGLLRYNPFNEAGGNQSFSIALLDLENNGFVITSLYGRESNKVYAKPIKKGKSKYELSTEEKKVIEEAISS